MLFKDKFHFQIKTLAAEIEDITGEFQKERTDYLDTIRRLDQQSKLLQSILDKVRIQHNNTIKKG